LEKTSKIINSNHQPNTTMSAGYQHWSWRLAWNSCTKVVVCPNDRGRAWNRTNIDLPHWRSKHSGRVSICRLVTAQPFPVWKASTSVLSGETLIGSSMPYRSKRYSLLEKCRR